MGDVERVALEVGGREAGKVAGRFGRRARARRRLPAPSSPRVRSSGNAPAELRVELGMRVHARGRVGRPHEHVGDGGALRVVVGFRVGLRGFGWVLGVKVEVEGLERGRGGVRGWKGARRRWDLGETEGGERRGEGRRHGRQAVRQGGGRRGWGGRARSKMTVRTAMKCAVLEMKRAGSVICSFWDRGGGESGEARNGRRAQRRERKARGLQPPLPPAHRTAAVEEASGAAGVLACVGGADGPWRDVGGERQAGAAAPSPSMPRPPPGRLDAGGRHKHATTAGSERPNLLGRHVAIHFPLSCGRQLPVAAPAPPRALERGRGARAEAGDGSTRWRSAGRWKLLAAARGARREEASANGWTLGSLKAVLRRRLGGERKSEQHVWRRGASSAGQEGRAAARRALPNPSASFLALTSTRSPQRPTTTHCTCTLRPRAPGSRTAHTPARAAAAQLVFLFSLPPVVRRAPPPPPPQSRQQKPRCRCP